MQPRTKEKRSTSFLGIVAVGYVSNETTYLSIFGQITLRKTCQNAENPPTMCVFEFRLRISSSVLQRFLNYEDELPCGVNNTGEFFRLAGPAHAIIGTPREQRPPPNEAKADSIARLPWNKKFCLRNPSPTAGQQKHALDRELRDWLAGNNAMAAVGGPRTDKIVDCDSYLAHLTPVFVAR